ncbi:hypothetical protein JXA12_01585 [Candidatus Woesearchaeota archaeon]|nr:hypothetical protein [Candidatus Woesearchaeota archaeon]
MNIIITGEKRAGKTRAARTLAELLRQGGTAPGGFLCEGPYITDLATGDQRRFLHKQPMEDAQYIGPFAIPNSAIRFGEAAVEEALRRGRYAFIDEYGKLELQGQGFRPLLERCLPEERCVVLVRDLNLDDFLERFAAHQHRAYTATRENRDALPKTIYKQIIEEKEKV